MLCKPYNKLQCTFPTILFHSYMQQTSLTLKHLSYWQQYRYSTHSLRSLTVLSSRSIIQRDKPNPESSSSVFPHLGDFCTDQPKLLNLVFLVEEFNWILCMELQSLLKLQTSHLSAEGEPCPQYMSVVRCPLFHYCTHACHNAEAKERRPKHGGT